MVSGIIDAVEERNESLISIENKKGQRGRHLSVHFQLCATGLCLEERTGRAIAHGEIFYYANRRRQRVPFTPELRHATETAIAAAHQASRPPMPAPIDYPEKCQACILQPISRDTLMAVRLEISLEVKRNNPIIQQRPIIL